MDRKPQVFPTQEQRTAHDNEVARIAAFEAEKAASNAELAKRPKASRANKSYKLETVDSMLAELTHRKIDIPERTKLVYVNGNPTYPDIPLSDYKQTLFDLMKNSYKK